ncbi:hypothetical protein Pyn_05334 [Prunus yedoensis var. nudiflora]|uniref:Uncharacterized protein n=1 Tax=Prunus yedoensis var. nudiflora TaxID=2094558 RepID=A0A314UPV8_PRUYE|nr:hypothetical protein Pyn_05334 [Prunus yedoensis var. nudiflora]
MDQHKTDDNLRYVSGLTHVLAANASISFADLRCQLPDKGFQNTDAGGDCEKNEDEDDFSFTCTNPNESPISTDDIFQNGQIRPMKLGGGYGVSVLRDEEDALMKTVTEGMFGRDG